MANQNPEQLARDAIDRLLYAAGRVVQFKQKINLVAATTGVAVRDYQIGIGLMDYMPLLNKRVVHSFDMSQVGLTATPDNRTFGYFDQNLVSDYGYEKAVIDGVLVPYNVFTIETKITKEDGIIPMGEKVDKRERLTRRRFWESIEEDIEYSNKQLDKDIVNKSQIRTIIRAMKDNLPMMFYRR